MAAVAAVSRPRPPGRPPKPPRLRPPPCRLPGREQVQAASRVRRVAALAALDAEYTLLGLVRRRPGSFTSTPRLGVEATERRRDRTETSETSSSAPPPD